MPVQTVVSTDVIWESLMAEPEMQEQHPAMTPALRPYVNALPSVLAEMLDEKVTLKSLLQAKVDWLKYALENGMLTATINALPAEAMGFYSAPQLIELLAGQLVELLEYLEPLLEDLQSMLEENGVTEAQALDMFDLRPEIRAQVEAGALTIAELLMQQPLVIVKTS